LLPFFSIHCCKAQIFPCHIQCLPRSLFLQITVSCGRRHFFFSSGIQYSACFALLWSFVRCTHTVDLLSCICSNLLLCYYHVIFAAMAWFAAVVQIWRLQLWSRSRGDSRELWQEWSDAVPQAGRPTCHIGQSFIPLYLWNITVLYSTKYGVKLQTLGTCSLHKSHWTPEALYNLGSDS